LQVNADLAEFGTSFPEVFRMGKNLAANFANKHEFLREIGNLPQILFDLVRYYKTKYLKPYIRIQMNLQRLNRITVEQGKCGGRPCIRGQRIRVTDILELLGAGASFEEILTDYEFLEHEDILAAIDYAAYQTDHVVLQT
jgi:uncharacterized protein (DUF433 family)